METLDKVLNNGITTTEHALRIFDMLEPVSIAFLTGRWKGYGFPTSHPMDGILETLGWYGKIFIDDDHVHPLVFYGKGRKELFALHPGKISMTFHYPVTRILRTLLLVSRPFFQTRKTKARLRMMEYRGKITAAMIYDDKPVTDYFGKVDEETILGVMDLKSSHQPFFFMLRRDDQSVLKLQL